MGLRIYQGLYPSYFDQIYFLPWSFLLPLLPPSPFLARRIELEPSPPRPCKGPTLGEPSAPTATVIARAAAAVVATGSVVQPAPAAGFEVDVLFMALPAAATSAVAARSATVSPGYFFWGGGRNVLL